ncbi:hypothetical protein [Mycoplasma phocoeninasale]|uniref:Uncharacterized protein n=1 Tax=Mycoplasma phocoeninasale TaxID=2726117 RepID=A0A858U6D2_9MOLU|nr:hypothetical protein [Mycoplasma phocoeninasale]MBN0970597.1 hypothetical protein [Mycoplasma phocoeninasale]QJG66286.1 hypothetical protein HGG64_00975 [Mycoplasma phocoeninasale]
MEKTYKRSKIVSGILIAIGLALFALIAIFLVESYAKDFISYRLSSERSTYIFYALIVPTLSAIAINTGIFLLLKQQEKLKNSKVASVIALVVMICSILIISWFYVNSLIVASVYNYYPFKNDIINPNGMHEKTGPLTSAFIYNHAIIFCGTFVNVTSIFWIAATSANIHRIKQAKNKLK